MDPEQPIPGLGHHELFGELSDEAIDALAEVEGPEAGSPLLLVMLRHGGGALRRAPDGAGALAKIDAAFAMNADGVPTSPEQGEAIVRHLDLGAPRRGQAPLGSRRADPGQPRALADAGLATAHETAPPRRALSAVTGGASISSQR
jgi:hypothetical protein